MAGIPLFIICTTNEVNLYHSHDMKIKSLECCSPNSDCSPVTDYLNQLSDSRYQLVLGTPVTITSGQFAGLKGTLSKRIFIRNLLLDNQAGHGKRQGVPGYAVRINDNQTVTAKWNEVSSYDPLSIDHSKYES